MRNVFVESQNCPPSEFHRLVISKEEPAALRKERDIYGSHGKRSPGPKARTWAAVTRRAHSGA